MTESGAAGAAAAGGGATAAAAKLSLTTGGGGGGSGHRDGRLVIGGVKAGDGSGPRVFLLSAVKTERPAAAADAGAASTSTPGSRTVSLLRTGEQVPACSSHSIKPFTTDTSIMQGKKRLWLNGLVVSALGI